MAKGGWITYIGGVRQPQKRKRSSRTFRPRKRRRRSWKRRGGGNTVTSSGQWGKPYAFGFKRKRMSARRWRNIIFRDTEAKTHYRSVKSFSETVTTPVSNDLSGTYFRFALIPDNVNPFWTAAGGLQDKDFGEAGPLFRDDKILRGGYCRLTLSNRSDTEALLVQVWLVWAVPNVEQTRLGTITSVLNAREWEPTLFPDFQRIGKVLYSRQCILKPGDNPFEITHRLKPQKIDDDVHLNGRGSQPIWMYKLVKMTDTDAAPSSQTVRATYGFNLSFSADAAT